uniref:Calponin-homology (CH) domain-containing protein n=1 Tax=Neolamprologus brichardi TaxID=32507 RepID=A0A3Q4N831_NEOBR
IMLLLWKHWYLRKGLQSLFSEAQIERELVQKRTFTRWINLHLEKCDPPIEVLDLFQDIRDGRILMALLEELSGCKLLHGFRKSSHRIFRLNNIAKVLSFLEERNVKLVSIDAVDIADGNSSIILGLIWNIILFFQIKELTGNIRSQFPSSSSLSSIPTSSDSDTSYSSTPLDDRQSASTAVREQSRAIKKLLQWVQKRTRKYGVAVQDFSKSWISGLAFLAVIKSIDSSLVDMRKALLRSSRENLEDAFRIAHYSLGIPRLLEPEGNKTTNKKEPEMLKGRNEVLVETQDEASEGLLKDSPDSQDTNNSVQITKALENTSSTNTEEVLTTSQDPSRGMNIPSISIVSVPEEQDDTNCNQEERGTADENLSQPLVFVSEVTDMCVNSTANPGEKSSASNKDDKIIAEGLFENAKATSSGDLMDPENQHLNDINEHNLSSKEYMQGQVEISEDGDKCKPPLDDSQGETNFSTEAETHIVDIDHAVNSTDPPDGRESKLADTFCSSDVANTQLSTLDPFNTEPRDEIGTLRSEPATVSRNMDVLFYTDFDRGSPTEDLVGDPVEPMDLFYPDKEELMFTDQPDTEAQTWPSVLSVSALQPAPPSDILPDDQQFDPLGEDFREVDLTQEHDEVNVNLFHFLGALRSVTLLRVFRSIFCCHFVFSLAIALKVCTAAAVQTYTTRHCL